MYAIKFNYSETCGIMRVIKFIPSFTMRLKQFIKICSLYMIIFVHVCTLSPSEAIRCYNCADWITSENINWCVNGVPMPGAGFEQDCDEDQQFCGKVVAQVNDEFRGGIKACISTTHARCFIRALTAGSENWQVSKGCKTLKAGSIHVSKYRDVEDIYHKCTNRWVVDNIENNNYEALYTVDDNVTQVLRPSKKVQVDLCLCAHENNDLCNSAEHRRTSTFWIFVIHVLSGFLEYCLHFS